MKTNNTLTIALTYENKDDSLVRDIMDSFLSAQDNCAKVYAVEKGDLFAKIEAIEEIINNFEYDPDDKVFWIQEVLHEIS